MYEADILTEYSKLMKALPATIREARKAALLEAATAWNMRECGCAVYGGSGHPCTDCGTFRDWLRKRAEEEHDP